MRFENCCNGATHGAALAVPMLFLTSWSPKPVLYYNNSLRLNSGRAAKVCILKMGHRRQLSPRRGRAFSPASSSK